MNGAIRRLFYLTVALFVCLLATLAYWQVFQAQSLADNPQNTRKIYAQMSIDRGLILAADRSELARNRKEDKLYFRVYPTGDAAPHLVGYSDPTYGQTGLERSQNSYLTGTAAEVEITTFLDTLLGREKRGADLRLTLNLKAQRTAVSELQKLGKRGSVVVLDVQTGAVLVMVSNPTYDPNQLAANWPGLNADPSAPLLNRATQGLYTPGSAFKLVTTAAALDTGAFNPSSRFQDDRGSIDIYGNTIRNWRDAPFGAHDLREAFSQSINTTFAQVSDQLGEKTLVEYMERFGFYEKPPFEIPPDEINASGRYNDGQLAPSWAGLDRVAVAWLGIGQESLQVTPLQMALIAQAIGNGGKLMKPYAVDAVADYNGTIVRQARAEEWKNPVRPETARQMKEMMVKVVNEGTGRRAQTSKVQIAAKTGTAEVGGRGPNAWFVGFAPADNPKVAIAVVIEDSDAGGGISGPVARDTILSVLNL